jgi:ubiquinol-cytochrome c reductase subunit 8
MHPTGVARHSKWFGHMGNLGGPAQKGLITYQLSSYQQRPFAGVLKHGVFNTFRRVSGQVPYILPAVLVFYYTYTWGNQQHKYLNSKAGLAAHASH